MFMFLDPEQSSDLAHLWSGGACFRHELGGKAWTCGENGITTVHGRQVERAQLTEMAVMVCASCPVQYDCARYAVRYSEPAGTWAMRRRNLEWLQNVEIKVADRISLDDALAIIDEAEAAGRSVEQHVASVRLAKRTVLPSAV